MDLCHKSLLKDETTTRLRAYSLQVPEKVKLYKMLSKHTKCLSFKSKLQYMKLI